MSATQERVSSAMLRVLLRPRAVVVIGASGTPGKLGWAMARSLDRFPGPVHQVNSGRPDAAQGVYESPNAAAAATGVPADLAVVCVPASASADAVRAAGAAGVEVAVICAGGFAEAGPDGADLQAELAEAGREAGVRLVGPNTSGLMVPAAELTASFVPGLEVVREGNVSVVAASGGVNHAVLFALANRNIGIRLAIGLGNAVDVDMADLVEALLDDDATGLVALHIESVREGRRLLDAVSRLVERVPVVASVVGRSDVSEFAQSHTGALSAPWRTTRAALRQAGAVVVDDERALVDAVATLSIARLPRRSTAARVGIITGQAGPGLLLADAVRTSGIEVPPLAEATTNALRDLLPPMTFQRNPVDTGRPGATFRDVVRTVSQDASIDVVAVYALIEPGAIDLADVLAPLSGGAVPILAAVGGPAAEVSDAQRRLAAVGIPAHDTPAGAAVGLRALVDDACRSNHPYDWIPATPDRLTPADRRFDEAEAKAFLASLGVAVPRHIVCESADAVRRGVVHFTTPVVLKILDSRVLHKTEIGGVHVGIATSDELERALAALGAIGATRFLLEEMAPPGIDMLLSARRDPTFGPIVTVAVGGVYADLIDDVAIRVAPIDHREGVAMISDLKMAALFDGWRGQPPIDVGPVAHLLCRLGDSLVRDAGLREIEVNPLRIGADGRTVALDAVMLEMEEHE